MEHTQGPWYVSPSKTCVMAGNRSLIVADCEGAPHVPILVRPHDETHANARLIAAAPELLEACRKALQSLLWRYDNLPVITNREKNALNTLQAAINKATGDASS